MTKYIIVGTSHISPKSVSCVSKIIREEKPDVVAVELCPKRYYALTHKLRGEAAISIFSKIQRKLGETTGVFPGKEMVAAVKTAQKIGSKVLFIDKDIDEIIYEMSKIPMREKLMMFLKIMLGYVYVGISRFDLTEVPDEKLVRRAVGELKKRFPHTYKVLIKDRNRHMLDNLRNLKCKKVVVVVGAGHKNQIERSLRRLRCSSSAGRK